MRLGDFQLFVLSDGLFRLNGGAMFGVVPRVLWEVTDPPDANNRILMGLNCLLIKTPEENILIDTGIGDKFSPKYLDIYQVDRSQNLLDSLKTCGVHREEISKVVLTHLHFDHAGGNTSIDEKGQLKATFPGAEYIIQKEELEAAENPDPRSRASYLPENWEPLEKLELVSGEEEIYPGIELLLTGGHTRGHQIVKITSRGKTACFLGDLIPTTSHLKVPYVMSYDLYPLDTMKFKERILKQALQENWLLIFEHSPRVKAGYLKEVEGKLQVEEVKL